MSGAILVTELEFGARRYEITLTHEDLTGMSAAKLKLFLAAVEALGVPEEKASFLPRAEMVEVAEWIRSAVAAIRSGRRLSPQRIVINGIHGGFSLSRAAVLRLCELGHPGAIDHGAQEWSAPSIDRTDPLLVRAVEELGAEANGDFASLKIVDVPGGVEWELQEYDGLEWVAEKHRTWE